MAPLSGGCACRNSDKPNIEARIDLTRHAKYSHHLLANALPSKNSYWECYWRAGSSQPQGQNVAEDIAANLDELHDGFIEITGKVRRGSAFMTTLSAAQQNWQVLGESIDARYDADYSRDRR